MSELNQVVEKVIESRIEESTKSYNERYSEAEKALHTMLALQNTNLKEKTLKHLRKLMRFSTTESVQEDLAFASLLEEVIAETTKGMQVMQEVKHKLVLHYMEKGIGDDKS